MSAGFDRLWKSARLAMPAVARLDLLIADHSIRITRRDDDRLEGRVSASVGNRESKRAQRLQKDGASSPPGRASQALASKLRTNTPRSKRGKRVSAEHAPMDFDRRQRAIMKIHYFNHSGGGGGGLKGHARYVGRHAVNRDQSDPSEDQDPMAKPRRDERDQASYLIKDGRGAFYDADGQAIDATTRLDTWAKADRRHFRLILSAEEGERLQDLPAYTRQVMARASTELDSKLSWVAVDHHDTDNPHTHIIVRGRRANGQDLILPRDFIKHGLRNIARDVATQTLGARTPEQEREALERDALRLGPSRLDGRIAQSATGRWEVTIDALRAKDHDPAVTQALKARVRELERMGLAKEVERGFFQLNPDWQDRLKAMELHIDVRKRLMRQRLERSNAQRLDLTPRLGKGGLER